jgi:type IV pilus assembly protein PilE
MRSQQGFTLVELMIVVVVIAIIAAIAVPSYRSYVLRAQRTDATAALLRVRTAQEKFFLQNQRYMDPAEVTARGLDASERGYYTIVSAVPDPDRPAMLGFKLTAAPVAGAPQDADTKCTSFTLNDTGTKGSAPDPVEKCWR